MLIVAAVAIRWRSGEVLAFGAVALSMALAAFATPLVSILNGLPLLGKVTWQSSLFPMDFALAVLAGVGMDVLVRSYFKRAVLSWVGGGFAVAALILVTIWAFGRGHLPPFEAQVRAKSFIWPAVETAVGVTVVGILIVVRRRGHQRRSQKVSSWVGAGRWAGLALLTCETAFLAFWGANLWSSSPNPQHSTPAEVTLEHAVGSSLVGTRPRIGRSAQFGNHAE